MYPDQGHHHHHGFKTFGELAVGDRFKEVDEGHVSYHGLQFDQVYVKIPQTVMFGHRGGRREVNARESHENNFFFVRDEIPVHLVVNPD